MESNTTISYSRHMALLWVRGLVPYQERTYAGYLAVINDLEMSNNDPDRINHALTAVFNQAKELGKSPEWIDQEVRFEAAGLFVDMRGTDIDARKSFLRMRLKESEGSDEGLDLYNLRLERFESK